MSRFFLVNLANWKSDSHIAWILARTAQPIVGELLNEVAAVALVGARQVGKTTLALEIASSYPSVYLDLESPTDRAKLSEPEMYLDGHADELVVLDEVQRLPHLFEFAAARATHSRRNATPILDHVGAPSVVDVEC